MSVCLSVRLCVCLPVCLSVCLSVYPSVCLSIYPSISVGRRVQFTHCVNIVICVRGCTIKRSCKAGKLGNKRTSNHRLSSQYPNRFFLIIIIAFKGAILGGFFTISSVRREPSSTRTLKWPGRNRVQITCNTFSAYHVHVKIRATWYEGTAQLLSVTELKSHLF